MAQQKNDNMTTCPECDGPIQLKGKPQIGQKLTCRQCRSALVVIDRKPLELDLASGNGPYMGGPNMGLSKAHIKADKKLRNERATRIAQEQFGEY